MEVINEHLIPVEDIKKVTKSPCLFPEVVLALGGTSLESMRQIRDNLLIEIKRYKFNEIMDKLA
jgi:hypothetical protein